MILKIATMVITLVTITHAEAWKKTADIHFNATQNAYTDNWTGGEIGSMSWIFNSNATAEKQFNEKINNKNTLKLAFGQTHNQNADTKAWLKPVKSTDLIDFESLLKLTLGSMVDPYTAGRVESQFIDAMELSLNPLKFTESAGASRTFIKKDNIDLNARAGLAVRQLISRTTDTSLIINDGGLDFIAEYTTPLGTEHITFNSKLQIYTAFFNSDADATDGTATEGYWKSPDINWENTFSAKITQYIDVNIYTQWLFDKEIDKVGRFKQTLSLGINYTLL